MTDATGPAREFTEDEAMSDDLGWPQRAAAMDGTRRTIAFILLALLGILVLFPMVLLLTRSVTEPGIRDLVEIAIAPVATLTGTAIGFFFGQSDRDRRV